MTVLVRYTGFLLETAHADAALEPTVLFLFEDLAFYYVLHDLKYF